MESTLAASTPPWQDVPYSSSSHGWISHHFSPLTSSSPLTFHPTDWRFEENGFGLFLLQCIVILTFCNAFGYAFQRLLGQPRVVGDLLAGVVIGPTALGNVPNFSHTVFPAIQTPLLNLVAQTGLVVFLFLVGLETDTELMLAHWHSVVLITVPPFALTFGVAVGIARLFWDELTDGAQPFTTFFVFVGTVMAVTSLSVLSRVLSEMGILATKMGAMAIAAGAGNDTLGYCLLAVASALAGGGKQIFALYQLLAFVAWLLFLVFIWRPLLFRWLAAAGVNNMSPSSTDHVPRILIVAGVLGGLVSSCVSDMFGLHTLVGAFFYGVAIPHGRYAVAITEAVETPVTLLLLPLYFGTVGLKIDFKTLNNGTVWGLIVLLIVVIFLVKGASTTLCAKLSGLQWRQAMCVGALMQSKGVIEVVIGAIALEAGVIDVQIFSALFLVFLATTSLVRPLARAIYLGQAEREQAMDGKQQGEEGRDDEDHDAEKGSIPDKLHGDNKGAATHSPTSRYPITAAVASVNPNVESLMTLINALAATTTPTTASLCLDIIRAVPTEFGFTEVLRAVSSSAAVSYTTHATAGTTAAGTARSYAHHDALLEALRAQAHLCNVPATISSREPEDDRDNGFLAVEASHILPEILAAHRRAQLRIGCPSRHQGIVICPWEGVSSAPDAGAEGNGTMSHSDSTGWLRTLAASAWGGHHHKAPADDDDAGDDHNSWYGSGAALPARLFTQRNVTTGVLIDGGGGGASARSSTSRNATSSSDIAQHVATLAESRLRERARRQRLPRLIIPFFGGVDDRAAVDFAKRAAAVARGGLVDVIVVLVDAAAALEQSADGQASGGISASSSAEVQEVLRAVGASTHESGTGADVTVDIQVADHAEQRKRDARFLFGPIEEEGTTDSEVVGDMAGEKPSSPPSSPSPSGLVTEVGPERLLYVTLPHSTPLYSVIETSLLLGTSSSDLILVGRGKHASRPATFRRDVVGEATRRLADGEEGTRMLSKAMGRTLGAAAEGVLLARRAVRRTGASGVGMLVVQAADGAGEA